MLGIPADVYGTRVYFPVFLGCFSSFLVSDLLLLSLSQGALFFMQSSTSLNPAPLSDQIEHEHYLEWLPSPAVIALQSHWCALQRPCVGLWGLRVLSVAFLEHLHRSIHHSEETLTQKQEQSDDEPHHPPLILILCNLSSLNGSFLRLDYIIIQ